jgi:hypothetical protein
MSVKPPICEKEFAVIAAVRRGAWEEELRAHAAACPVCSEVVLVAQALGEMHAADLSEARVPAAGWMWWRMQLRAKREAGERATQPITLIERVTYACIAFSAIGLCLWNWHSIFAWFASLGSATRLADFSIEQFVAAAWDKAGLLALISCGGFLIFLSFIAYLIWADERISTK